MRIPGNNARGGAVPAAPDYRTRLRDLYARRTSPAGGLGADAVKTRGDAVTRSVTPRYEPRLRNEVGSARPEPSPTPRTAPPTGNPTSTPRVAPKPGAPTPRVAPRDPGGSGPPTAAPAPRITPGSNRYPVPGREPRVGSPGGGVAPAPTAGTPRLRPGTPDPIAKPIPTPKTGAPRVRPNPRPYRPGDTVGGRNSGSGNPTLRQPGDGGGGRGPRFGDHWNRYNGWSASGSHRYQYGSYHWSGHYACFWPSHNGWGCYSYPYLYCGSWYRYWYNCRSSFVVYWNSRGPSYSSSCWWWPSSCYLPGSWLGYYGFGSWCGDYADWAYLPRPTYIVREVVAGSDAVPAGDEAPAADEDDGLTEIERLAQRHLNLGDFYFRQGRYEEAAESYVRALAYAPDDGALHFVLADALFAQGDYHYAAYIIGRALSFDPGLARAKADKREFYDDPKQFDEQLATLRTYLAEKPYDAAAYLVLGYNLRFSGQPAEAAKAFERVVGIDPGNAAARAFLDGLAEPEVEEEPAGAADEAGGDSAPGADPETKRSR